MAASDPCSSKGDRAMWLSWPQACMAPFFEAKARPVASSRGRPSMSARTISVGPSDAPCRVAVSPVLPIPVRTSSAHGPQLRGDGRGGSGSPETKAPAWSGTCVLS